MQNILLYTLNLHINRSLVGGGEGLEKLRKALISIGSFYKYKQKQAGK